jgi:hypothetical protein
VHVVNQHHDRFAGDQAGEERQPVLDVDHDVRVTEVAAAQRPHPLQVDRDLRTPADEADALDDLLGRRCSVRRAEDRDLGAALDQPGGDRLEVALRPATLRVAGVAPAQEDDLPPTQGVDLGHPRKDRTPGMACEDRRRW